MRRISNRGYTRTPKSSPLASPTLLRGFACLFALLILIPYYNIISFQASTEKSEKILIHNGDEVSQERSDNTLNHHKEKKKNFSNNRKPRVDSIQLKERTPKNPSVAYVISLTACPSDGSLLDAAAVLAHSIKLSNSTYPYKLYAIAHPDTKSCLSDIEEFGYNILHRDTPVDVEEIRGEFLRRKIVDNGCCGEKELIKLWAYTLVDHPIAVHLDTDVLILHNLDKLFDVMLGKGGNLPVAFGKAVPTKVDAFITKDYNMVAQPEKAGVQGGFLVLRPDMDVFQDYLDIVREGDFREGGGWAGKVGKFYGGMTFQGIVPYYYFHQTKRVVNAVELDRCYYNNMADNPMDKSTINDVLHGKCRDGREKCEDCRRMDVKNIVTAHFTLCQKPWLCMPHDQDIVQARLCKKLHSEWFKVRADLEDKVWERDRKDLKSFGGYHPDIFLGFCEKHGKRGYVPMQLPGEML